MLLGGHCGLSRRISKSIGASKPTLSGDEPPVRAGGSWSRTGPQRQRGRRRELNPNEVRYILRSSGFPSDPDQNNCQR